MGIKEDIKSKIIQSGKTMSEVIELINNKYNKNDTVQNLSNKLSRGTLKYSEALEIADVIGCTIQWVKLSDD
jgi:hypoxanthine-guanine phosphoribosyltransferase